MEQKSDGKTHLIILVVFMAIIIAMTFAAVRWL